MKLKLQDKILVIEDDQWLLKTIYNILAFEGYDVCMANNGALGIQKAFEFNPDLILCDITMNPIDGYQVFNVLKESSLLDQVPFIFITSNSELKDIRFGLDMGADDYFVKPFKNDDLIHSVRKRLDKYNKLREIGRREFKALYKIAPYGIFLFDGNIIFDTNPALSQMLGIASENIEYKSIENMIDTVSYLSIEDKINRCSKGLLDSFKEQVYLNSKKGLLEVNLYVTVYEKYSGYSLMLGLFTDSQFRESENEEILSGVIGALKKENIAINESLELALTEVFQAHGIIINRQESTFFSKRETEVLCLSMEGLPMKLIADKLSISGRTVEKHRANLMEKTKSKNMIEVIIYALRNNLIEI
jgi:DNA-binding NarL/FixJ family response regulator